MPRHDVYRNPGGGYLLDLQSDLLSGLNTRVVAPLMPRERARMPAALLNPVFEVEGVAAVMVTQFMAAVPVAELGRPVGSLGAQHDTIVAAVDMVMQGFRAIL